MQRTGGTQLGDWQVLGDNEGSRRMGKWGEAIRRREGMMRGLR